MMTQFIPREWFVAEALVCAEFVDPVSCLMHEMGSNGVTIEDEESPARITAYFNADLSAEARRDLLDQVDRLSHNFPEFEKPKLIFRTILSENWAVAWKDNFKIMEVGSKLLISPPWLNPSPDGRHVIIIEPAEAFGTGSHETTQGCLELIEECVEARAVRSLWTSVLDVGCGSGILAIAAAKLGANAVVGIDNDPIAIESALENAALNQVDGKIDFDCLGIEASSGSFDVVTANLDAMALSANVSELKARFDDCLIISGVTVDQWDFLRDQFERRSLRLVRELKKNDWVSAVFSHQVDELA